MLKPKKKLTKKELKQDTLVTTYAQVTSFYDTHKKQINIGITALVVVIIATMIFLKNRAENNDLATTQLSAIHQYYDNGQYQLAIDGAPDRNLVGLKAIVDKYGSSPAGDLARFYLADAYYQLGKYSEALEAFKDCSPSTNVLKASRYAGIAACYEALNDYKNAARAFEDAAGKEDTDNAIAEQLSSAAHNYALAGEKSNALDLFKRIKKNYPTTTAGRDADRFITQLSV
jgi:tetratricopeptide (TPR) repeat protein